ncbi:MAG: cyanovirin [Okeania sp. SIO3C4]|nr:cyanovirin [Okeania sp. SIO3C4]
MFANQAWAGDFSGSCSDSYVSGAILSSTCKNNQGGTNPTEIDLNLYIGNVNGKLVWQKENFIATCSSTQLVGSSVLVAQCEGPGGKVPAQINLDERIGDNNGYLTYGF